MRRSVSTFQRIPRLKEKLHCRILFNAVFPWVLEHTFLWQQLIQSDEGAKGIDVKIWAPRSVGAHREANLSRQNVSQWGDPTGLVRVLLTDGAGQHACAAFVSCCCGAPRCFYWSIPATSVVRDGKSASATVQ